MKKFLGSLMMVFILSLTVYGQAEKAEAASKDIYIDELNIDATSTTKTPVKTYSEPNGEVTGELKPQKATILQRLIKANGVTVKDLDGSNSIVNTTKNDVWFKYAQNELDQLILSDNQTSLWLQKNTSYYTNLIEAESGKAAPQRVEVVEQWMQVQIGTGETYWVKFDANNFKNIFISDLASTIYVGPTKNSYIQPDNGTNPQPVTYQEVKVKEYWFIVSTWLGDKYIKFTSDELDNLYLSADGTKVVNGVTKSLYSKTYEQPLTSSVSPQDLTVKQRWYKFTSSIKNADGTYQDRYLGFNPPDKKDIEYKQEALGINIINPKQPEWSWVTSAMTLGSYYSLIDLTIDQNRIWEIGKQSSGPVFKGLEASGQFNHIQTVFSEFGLSYRGTVSTLDSSSANYKTNLMNQIRGQIDNPLGTGKAKPLISQFEVAPGGSYDGAVEGKVYAPVIGYMHYRGKSAVEIVSYNPSIAGKGTNKQIDVPIGRKTYISIDNFVSNEDLKFVSNLINIEQ
ncbi:hypothetical protein MZM54_00260 [[Brevibacterium] frigoritolerans]|nr:hypothetical protein [Peribacillus frigoritolerans]